MLWSLVGVALIGVTAIAYKDPAVYRRLTLAIIPILLCLLFASVGWNWGESSVYQSLEPHLAAERAEALMTRFFAAIDEKSAYDAAMLITIACLFFSRLLASHAIKGRFLGGEGLRPPPNSCLMRDAAKTKSCQSERIPSSRATRTRSEVRTSSGRMPLILSAGRAGAAR